MHDFPATPPRVPVSQTIGTVIGGVFAGAFLLAFAGFLCWAVGFCFAWGAIGALHVFGVM